MRMKALLAAMSAAALLVACGGGGSDAGVSAFGTGAGSGIGGGGGGSGSVPGTVVPSTPSAMTFEAVSPSGVPLLIQGAAAAGRTDTGTLSFQVVDQVGAPVPNESVTFSVSPPSAVTLNISSATTDANGMATTSVTSKAIPTTVVVTAVLASNSAIRAVSNSLNISGGDPVPQAFQVVAEKYNLDARFVGDDTEVSAYVGDGNGNPVADGFAVNFTTDAGLIGGGCVTVNGVCQVTFRVQAPYGTGIATISATGMGVSDSIKINMAGATGAGYQLSQVASGTPAVTTTALTSCKQDVIYYLGDGAGRAAAKGSTVSVATGNNGASATIKLGSPVNDALDGVFAPTLVIVSYDLTGLTSGSPCANGGAATASNASVIMELRTPNGVSTLQPITLTYPAVP